MLPKPIITLMTHPDTSLDTCSDAHADTRPATICTRTFVARTWPPLPPP